MTGEGLDDFDEAAEAEWQRLRAQIELAEGFWLGFVFTDAPRRAATLRERVGDFLRSRGSRVRWALPGTPGDLRRLAGLISASGKTTDPSGCIWVEAIDGEEQWLDAWMWLAARLNEHRESLRRALRHGLLIVAPTAAKPLFHEVAPDLWSIRDLVLDFPVQGGTLSLACMPPRASPTTTSEELALTARALDALPDGAPASVEADLWLRACEGLLASARTREAIDAAMRALSLLRGARDGARGGSPALVARALRFLGHAEWSDGDLAASRAHLREMADVVRQGRAESRSPAERRELAGIGVGGLVSLAGIEAELGAPHHAETLRREARSLAEEPALDREARLSLIWQSLVPMSCYESEPVASDDLDHALAIAEELYDATPTDRDRVLLLARSLWLRSRADFQAGDVASARARLHRAARLLEGLDIEGDDSLPVRIHLADVHRALYRVEDAAGFHSAEAHRTSFIRLGTTILDQLRGWSREQWERALEEARSSSASPP